MQANPNQMSAIEKVYDLDRATLLPSIELADTRAAANRIIDLLRIELGRSELVQPDWDGALCDLHQALTTYACEYPENARRIHDESNLMLWLRQFAASAEFQVAYMGLLRALRSYWPDHDFVFEAIPVVRCILPATYQPASLMQLRRADGTLVAEHTDMLYQDPPGQVNAWLALTDSIGTSTLHLAPLAYSLNVLHAYFGSRLPIDRISDSERIDFFRFLTDNPTVCNQLKRQCVSMYTPLGHTRLFDMRRLHGTADNLEAKTRFSIDFRLVPLSIYDHMQTMRGGPPCYAGVTLSRNAFYAQKTIWQI